MDKYCLVECIGFNILPNISRGGEILEGGNFNPKKGKFWYILPYKIQFLPLNLQIFAVYIQKSANFDIFSQISAILDNFPLLKVKNMGKFFHNFVTGRGKNRFLWQNIHLCLCFHCECYVWLGVNIQLSTEYWFDYSLNLILTNLPLGLKVVKEKLYLSDAILIVGSAIDLFKMYKK